MQTQQQKTILVADDDLAILDVLTLILEDAGYRVKTTASGAAVREIIAQELPDLLLLDIWLSGWNGKDICRALKSEKQTQHLPIVLFSASRETSAIAQEVGADDFVVKPFEMDNLLQKLQNYLSLASRREREEKS